MGPLPHGCTAILHLARTPPCDVGHTERNHRLPAPMQLSRGARRSRAERGGRGAGGRALGGARAGRLPALTFGAGGDARDRARVLGHEEPGVSARRR